MISSGGSGPSSVLVGFLNYRETVSKTIKKMIFGLSLTNGIESEEEINRESNRMSCLFWWKFKTKPELWFQAFFFYITDNGFVFRMHFSSKNRAPKSLKISWLYQ